MNRKTLGAALLSAALISSLTVPAAAFDRYPDLPESHWAYPDMHAAAELDLIKGIGDGLMGPDVELSWGQYLTMLARTLSPETYKAALASGLAWDMAGYQTVRELDLIREEDFLAVTPENLSQAITRQDVAVLLDRALPQEVRPTSDGTGAETDSYDLTGAQGELTDWSAVGEEYQKSVARMYNLDIIKGKSDHSFGGTDILHRADGTVLLMRAVYNLDKWLMGQEMTVCVQFVDGYGEPLAIPEIVRGQVGADLDALVTGLIPEGYQYDYRGMQDHIQRITCISDSYDLILCPAEGSQQTDPYPELPGVQPETQPGGQGSVDAGDPRLSCEGDNDAKRLLLFGSTDRNRYADKAESEANMTSVTVPVWKLKGNQKVSSTMSFSINKALADDVVEIFTEIYNDPEQFPMCDLGGFNWRGDTSKSEHNCGTAIDINWDQNYQVRDGVAQTGHLWQPGVNPYSITENGSVVRAFTSHGWSWGGNAWCGHSDQTRDYHDYMHFSYLGR